MASFQTLKLNGIVYNKSQLLKFIASKKQITIWQKNLYSFIKEWLSNVNELSLKTSGSTGKPKTIIVSKKAMINSALATGEFLNLQKNDNSLLCLPCSFVAGKMMVVRAFVLELNLITTEPKCTIKNIENIDFCAMTPMQAELYLSQLSNIKKTIIGGGEIHFELEKKLHQIHTNIYHTYGMTETVSHIAMRKLGEQNFKPLPNIKLSQDNRKCLIINAPLLTDKKLITNDIVHLNSEGFIWKGRYDNVINSGGIKIFAEEIEKKISFFIDYNFIIVGIKDNFLGEKMVLILEGKHQNIELEKIHNLLNKYEKIHNVYFTDKFVYTPNGKINRKETLQKII